MKVGITYDLKDDYLAQGFDSESCAEFDSLETIDAIEDFLKSRGYVTERIGNIRALTRALAANKTWDLVFNIAEGINGRGREAQVPALLDAYDIPYVFSDPLVLSLTLDKALTKRVVRDAGVRTAPFCVIYGIFENGKWHSDVMHDEEHNAWLYPPVFVKPNADGTGKGITAKSLAKTFEEYTNVVNDLLMRFGTPVLSEKYLSGREFTVGITGTGMAAEIIGVMEIILNENADACGYTYENKHYYEERVRYELAGDAEAKEAGDIALQAWQILGCRDGGRVDIRSDENGRPHFLEVNPLAGLHPVLGDVVILSRLAGISYKDLLGRILDSALADAARFPHPQKAVYA